LNPRPPAPEAGAGSIFLFFFMLFILAEKEKFPADYFFLKQPLQRLSEERLQKGKVL